MKPTKCPARKKKKNKMRQEKRKKKGGEKAKFCCCVTFNPQIKILLSEHARTTQADILHLDQKAVKGTTCKQVCGKF